MQFFLICKCAQRKNCVDETNEFQTDKRIRFY